MNRPWKWLAGVIAVLLVAGSLTGVAVAQDAEAELSIKSFSLSLENNVYMNFKVESRNVSDPSKIQILAWDEAPAAYKKGSEDLVLTSRGTETGTGLELFQYTNLSAKDMTKVVYVCAYLNEGGEEVYSEPAKFSIAMYAYLKRAAAEPDEDLVALLDQMLDYGAEVQLYFNHNTDFLANAPIGQVSVVNGTLPDGFSLGWYQVGSTVTLTADKAAEGYRFSHWENSAGEKVSTDSTYNLTVTNNAETYTAKYVEGLDNKGDLSSDGWGPIIRV